ncbi:CubicO group peptidase, beta-lactamase class C family [Granulicella pectinivorans]|uniref:CubicO group peptidase, beta-lactamase class C family n=1 Tax=Granulicella pectinivorans TaxID=474950 RepID=A0A1I6LJK3_9BACT|nr:serine hydrolase domain-containing protein [Granulicella pectinivorans]SFS03583.1 CubicO group peptidase, beta-lactamase class C family [Granulicella pectinivorans]
MGGILTANRVTTQATPAQSRYNSYMVNPSAVRIPSRRLLAAASLLLTALPAHTQQTDGLKARLEAAIPAVLKQTATPSAQIGIVRDGRVIYTGAFGLAQTTPAVPATPDMPYRVGSVSKQFTAAAVMVLVERGKLRLDDPVSTWFPEFGHSSEITLRMLLNQVSGYSDDYTEDYLTPEMAAPIDPYKLIQEWTAKPLDFAPGTRWQYSNTNYGLAGLIVQKVAGEPFFQFLRENILLPAGLTHAIDLDGPSVPAVPVGYIRNGFGPIRPAIQEGKGTVFGAGELAMPIGDLAKWNAVVLHHQILKPESWQTLQTEYTLPDGKGSGYAMGFFLRVRDGRRLIDHGGEVNGFVSLNTLYPAEGIAIAILTNAESSTSALTQAVETAVFAPEAKAPIPRDPAAEALVKNVIAQLQQGKLDRSLIAPNLNFYFTDQVIADYKTSLAPLGPIQSIEPLNRSERGGMTGIFYKVQGTGAPIGVFIYVMNDGKLDQFVLEKLN